MTLITISNYFSIVKSRSFSFSCVCVCLLENYLMICIPKCYQTVTKYIYIWLPTGIIYLLYDWHSQQNLQITRTYSELTVWATEIFIGNIFNCLPNYLMDHEWVLGVGKYSLDVPLPLWASQNHCGYHSQLIIENTGKTGHRD